MPERALTFPSKIEKRDPTYTSQAAAASELRMMSQPTTVPSLKNLPNYWYDDKAGEGTFIYLLEDGINVAPDVGFKRIFAADEITFHVADNGGPGPQGQCLSAAHRGWDTERKYRHGGP